MPIAHPIAVDGDQDDGGDAVGHENNKANQQVQVVRSKQQHGGFHANSIPVRMPAKVASSLPGRGDSIPALTAVDPENFTVAKLLAIIAVRDRAHHAAARGGILLRVVLLHVVHPVLAGSHLHADPGILGRDLPATTRQLPPPARGEEQQLGRGVQELHKEHASQQQATQSSGLCGQQHENHYEHPNPKQIQEDAEHDHEKCVHDPNGQEELCGLHGSGRQDREQHQ
mmetsp:Transcript_18869/g.33517  ORF Transcript_18869/g.33517 Transcript_18869/m.33517 type:complete len:227 (-) Transcript_18869:3334-4014(-)